MKKQQSQDFPRILNAKRPIVIDVGANRGQWASLLLSLIPGARIFAFEPNPTVFDELSNWAVHSGGEVTTHNLAISSRGGEVTSFFVMAGDQGSSLLRPLPGQPSMWLTESEEITVECVRLDEFLDEHIPSSERVEMLKVDAQGSDLDVLLSAGSQMNPQRIGAVHAELNFVDFYDGQNAYHEVFSFLDKKGYRLARLYPRYAHDGWLWAGDALFIPK